MKDFSRRVIKIALSIPAGKVATYGEIARAAGGGGQAARSVNGILVKAYERGEKIPFHRIVYSNGTIFQGFNQDAARRKMYRKEGIDVDKKGRITNFGEVRMSIK